jgi:hemerythrin-like metal-binding protein
MIRWDPSFAIGVAEIDRQHEALFDHAGRIERLAQGGDRQRRLEEELRFLAAYVATHFAFEERLMRDTGYPGHAAHAREHRELERRLASLFPQWESEGASTAMVLALMGFVDGWLRDHIQANDLRIGWYLAARTPSRRG